MEPSLNSILNSAAIKQPKPSVGEKAPEANIQAQTKTVKKPKREIVRPQVGVVDAPQISTTPMSDTITIKKQENPHTVYKLSSKNKKPFHFQSAMSSIVAGCGILAVISTAVKKFKNN